MKRIILVGVTMAGLVLGLAAFTYDHSDGAYGPPGSTLLLGSEEVDDAKVGLTCDVVIDIGNNDSVRPGSDIVVESGASSVAFPNSEGVKGDPGPKTVQMVMGESISATLTFGPNVEYQGNAAFSGYGSVEVGDCEEPPPPTTTPPTVPPTTTTPPTVVPPAPPTPVPAVPKVTG